MALDVSNNVIGFRVDLKGILSICVDSQLHILGDVPLQLLFQISYLKVITKI